jgi:hypothetical protein
MRGRCIRVEAGASREASPGVLVHTAIPTEVNCKIEGQVSFNSFNRNDPRVGHTYIDQLCELDGKRSHIYVGRKYDLVQTKRHANKAEELRYGEKR